MEKVFVSPDRDLDAIRLPRCIGIGDRTALRDHDPRVCDRRIRPTIRDAHAKRTLLFAVCAACQRGKRQTCAQEYAHFEPPSFHAVSSPPNIYGYAGM